MDQHQIHPPGGEISWTNTTIGVLPPKRSLKSWLALSYADTSNLPREVQKSTAIKARGRGGGDNNQMDNRINDAFAGGSSQELPAPFNQEWPRQCVAHDN